METGMWAEVPGEGAVPAVGVWFQQTALCVTLRHLGHSQNQTFRQKVLGKEVRTEFVFKNLILAALCRVTWAWERLVAGKQVRVSLQYFRWDNKSLTSGNDSREAACSCDKHGSGKIDSPGWLVQCWRRGREWSGICHQKEWPQVKQVVLGTGVGRMEQGNKFGVGLVQVERQNDSHRNAKTWYNN